MSWLNKAKQFAVNLPGWRTKRKIVVIQSDDWGSIRLPSLRVREKLNEHSLINATDPYCHFDTLERKDDLSSLFEVLSSVKDRKGDSAVLTANCLMANPDFDAIKKSNFQKYYYETIDKSFERHNNSEALKLWREGKSNGIFIPQFHGREHINVPFWMNQLRSGHEGVHAAFREEVCSVNFHELPYRKNNFQAAWDFYKEEEHEEIKEIIKEGLKLFGQMFQAHSITAVAPSYVWSSDQEKLLAKTGVSVMQGTPFQFIPNNNKNHYRKKFRYTQITTNKKIGFQMRNVFFEPTLQPGVDVIGNCLKRIETAFLLGKPAIIGSHRVNFIGSLNEKNRKNNLILFKKLLNEIVGKWPQVEFLSSDQLFSE